MTAARLPSVIPAMAAGVKCMVMDGGREGLGSIDVGYSVTRGSSAVVLPTSVLEKSLRVDKTSSVGEVHHIAC